MERRTNLFVSRKNVLTWLTALCLVCSAVARIVIAGLKGSGESLYVWSQIILPVTASLLFVLITLLKGKELFYKTAVPVWMISAYFGFAITNNYEFGKMIITLYWICLFFFALMYTEITAGKVHFVWLLFPLLCAPMMVITYLYRDLIRNFSWNELLRTYYLPNKLLLAGLLLQVLAIRVYPSGEWHPTWGDRIDGRRIRSTPPITQIIPYIMPDRTGSSQLFEESFEITQIDRYIRQKRKEGLTDFGITHVLLAAYCRGVARYPALNRFLAGQRIYSRGNDIQFCIVVKKEMTVSSPDTVVKIHLTPYDTAVDIYNKLNTAVEEVKHPKLDSSLDYLTQMFTMIPGIFLKFTMWLIRCMDYLGILPQTLLELSPFHGSLFFTSMGSLGIKPVYHHLYDFGNLPVFSAFGCKRRANEVTEDGTVVPRKYIDMKFTVDERIVDGFYYATFFKYYRRLLRHPEVLDQPPETVVRDID